MSGSVCLDVINQTWSPMFDLANVFEVFLPPLLMCLNPSDPLNGKAATVMMSCRAAYEQKVKGLKEIVKSCTDSSNKAVNRLIAQDTNNKSLSSKLGRRKSLLPKISEANGNTNGRSSRFSLDEKVS